MVQREERGASAGGHTSRPHRIGLILSLGGLALFVSWAGALFAHHSGQMSLRHVSTIALGLAAVILTAAVARLALSLRQQRALNESRQHQASTDELTVVDAVRTKRGPLPQPLVPPRVG